MPTLPALLASALESAGDEVVLAAGGAVIGLVFGFFAQRSSFCLRAAVVEFARGTPGERLAVWLMAFSTAVIAVQAMVAASWIDVSSARQLAVRGSVSGALLGGLLFGAGMVMTRGCASRLVVLAASGNLRSLLCGLIFAVTAQSALGGALAPLRLAMSSWWTVEGGASRDLLAVAGLPHWLPLLAGVLCIAGVRAYARREQWSTWRAAAGAVAGLTVAMGWAYTATVAASSFQVVPVQGLTFSAPAAEWLMRVVATPGQPAGFDSGLLPGVFIGALVSAVAAGAFKLEGFRDGYSMRRYIVGAILMGFGAMLGGGCAVGAGLSGGAIFSLTAWLALAGMWLGAAVTDRLLDAGTPG